jgi:putative SOS response-associated peptidase YedK
MCGRYVTPAQSEIERLWYIGRHNASPLPRRFDISPTAIVSILHIDRNTGKLEFLHACLGLIPPRQ